MKKVFIIMGIVAGAFLAVGTVLTGIGFAVGVSDSIKLYDSVKLELWNREPLKTEYMKLDDFNSMDIRVDLGSIEITEGTEYAIEYELYADSIKCEVNDGCLVFRGNAEKESGFNFSIFGKDGESYLKIYIPEQKLDSVKIDSKAGTVEIKDMVCENLAINCNLGDVKCKNVEADEVKLDIDMGGLTYEGRITGKIGADMNMGSTVLKGWLDCDVDIETDLGSVDIVTYYSLASYRLKLKADMGAENTVDKGKGIDSEKTHNINVDCDMGSINVIFGAEP